MWVHWGKKQLRFTYLGNRISLQGLPSSELKCTPVAASKYKGLLNRKAISKAVQVIPLQWSCEAPGSDTSVQVAHIHLLDVPDSVKTLLDQYQDLFQSPNALPPKRDFDHHIQLMPGAQPVNIRPYRYSPVQKSKIEKQVKEMLASGIIKHSSSPYASPVLLVKKKMAHGGSVLTTGILMLRQLKTNIPCQ